MSGLKEFYMESTDEKSRLHAMLWLPDDGTVRAVIQLSHGIAEHIARYDAFARFMADNGFLVAGNSLQGHGLSAAGETGRRVFADKNGWDIAVNDMRALYEKESAEYPGLPYFLLGHSMGSFLARTFIIRFPELLTGCVLSGTGQQPGLLIHVGLAAAGLEKALFGAGCPSVRLNRLSFGAYNRRIPHHRTPHDWLSRDAEIVDLYEADDACGFVPSAGMFSDMLGGIRFIGKKKNIGRMRKSLPVLMISGVEDPVGDYGKGPKKVRDLFEAAGLPDVTLKLYEGARHEVLNELNRREVFQDILRWLQERMPDGGRED
jgi:alpha-beta hydrolase superfamily lysophospholipase